MKIRAKANYFLMLLLLGIGSLNAEVIINEDRNFVIDSETIIKLDGELIDPADFEQKAEGLTAVVILADDVDATVSSGTTIELRAVNQIKGPVTNLDPLQVLGQNVISTAETFFENSTGVFTLGELLEVSGSFDDQSNLLATRIESNANLPVWKLLAHVSAVNGDNVSFGSLTVSITGVTTNDCDSGISVGQLVEIKANPIENFSISNPLDSLTKFECKNGLVNIPNDPASPIVGMEIEGFVTQIIDSTHFEVNSQPVEISPNVTYVNGTTADLVAGVKVEVEGTFNTDTLLFTALKIDFRQTRVRIEAPVLVANLTADQITLMSIAGIISSLTDDKDNLLPGGLTSDTQIEVRGFVDSSGTVLVDEFRDRGPVNFNDTRLRGPVSSLSNSSFEILNVMLDRAGASYFDNNDLPIAESDFIAALFDGALVDINHGVYDSQLNLLTGGEYTLEFNLTGLTSKQSANQVVMASGFGGIGLGKIDTFIPAATTPPPAPTTPPPAPTTPPPATSSGGGGGSLLFGCLGLFLLLFAREKNRC